MPQPPESSQDANPQADQKSTDNPLDALLGLDPDMFDKTGNPDAPKPPTNTGNPVPDQPAAAPDQHQQQQPPATNPATAPVTTVQTVLPQDNPFALDPATLMQPAQAPSMAPVAPQPYPPLPPTPPAQQPFYGPQPQQPQSPQQPRVAPNGAPSFFQDPDQAIRAATQPVQEQVAQLAAMQQQFMQQMQAQRLLESQRQYFEQVHQADEKAGVIYSNLLSELPDRQVIEPVLRQAALEMREAAYAGRMDPRALEDPAVWDGVVATIRRRTAGAQPMRVTANAAIQAGGTQATQGVGEGPLADLSDQERETAKAVAATMGLTLEQYDEMRKTELRLKGE